MSDNATSQSLIWMDLEMTGLDPECDRILELATLVTDSELNLVAEGPLLYVKQSEDLIGSMDEWNTEHHMGSGLIDLVREPMGPAIVTKDEFPDPQALNVKLWKNGELEQDYSTSDMAHSVVAQIAWLTQYIQLEPGDVVSCGTHHRGLCNINDGDVVKMEVEDFGPLQVSVRSYGPEKLERWAPPGTRK